MGDNVDKRRGVRDIRSDHHGQMKHMFSLLAVKSRAQGPSRLLPFHPPDISKDSPSKYLPNESDVRAIKSNLVVLTSRVLCEHIKMFKRQKGSVVKHIPHPHSAEMATKSDVVVCDVLHKNETKRVDMIDIMMASQHRRSFLARTTHTESHQVEIC